VIDAVPEQEQIKIVLQDGQTYLVDKVVLALGNHPPVPFAAASTVGVQCIQDPWDYSALKAIERTDPVLILGTGLSMIDTVLTLHHQQHQGKITALSRRGLIPLMHVTGKVSAPMLPSLPVSLRQLTKQIRSIAKTCMKTGGDWRAIITSLRLRVPACWQAASVRDKQQFLRHVLPYWNIHRHRVHQSIGQLLESLRAQHQLDILAARLVQVHAHQVEIQLRHRSHTTLLPVKWVVNCMGPSLTVNADASALTTAVLKRGVAVMDALKLGFAIDLNGALLNQTGKVSTRFFTLGAPSKGIIWESTAVPDIRKQCLTLAQHLLQPTTIKEPAWNR